ncbi:MAG: shikimate kinase [Peptostreptococcaceae bacterium]|nr:shikimate kinase [Peptostreptococcaceae bacterium]
MKIILIGLMGAGKTTIGKELSNKLNLRFIDMDDEIEKQSKMSIVDIFEKYGENRFREIESKLLEKIALEDDIIISTGGGIIKVDDNRKLLKKQDNVVFLNGSIDTLVKNVSNDIYKRPLLKDSTDLYIKIEELLKERYEKYKESSNIIIDINNKNINEVVSQILVYIR